MPKNRAKLTSFCRIESKFKKFNKIVDFREKIRYNIYEKFFSRRNTYEV